MFGSQKSRMRRAFMALRSCPTSEVEDGPYRMVDEANSHIGSEAAEAGGVEKLRLLMRVVVAAADDEKIPHRLALID